MRPESETGNGTRPGSDVLRSCTVFLSLRDFSSCREFAHRISRSDPDISAQVAQILAIADVLGAAANRLGNNQLDWYSILQLRRSDAENRDLVRQQFKTLVRLLDPNKNKFPLADEALMRVREAWVVLSDPTKRARFDSEIHTKATSFWTMCPYCWYLHEYERKYEGCTFRCGNCQKTFHGTAVKPPVPEAVVEGKEQYYCYHVSLPLRYPVNERSRFGYDVVQGNGINNGGTRLRVKTVANRVKMKRFVHANSDSDMDAQNEDGV